MAIANLQNVISTGAATLAIAVPGVTAGSLLVAGATVSANATMTFSDNNGGTWATAGTYFDTTAAAVIAIGFAMNVASGSPTVTCTPSTGTAFKAIGVGEFSGAATSSALDNTPAGNHQAPSTTHTATSVSPSQAGCLVVMIEVIDLAAPTMTVGSGFTLLGYNSGAPLFLEFQIQTTATPVAPTATCSPSGDAGMMTAVFRPASGAAVTPPSPVMSNRAWAYSY